MIITTKEIIGNFTAKYSEPKTVTPEKPQLHEFQKKMQSYIGALHQYFLMFFQIQISYLALEH